MRRPCTLPYSFLIDRASSSEAKSSKRRVRQIQKIVRFSPTATGTQTGTLTVNSEDPDTPSVDVDMSGDGAASVNRAATFDENSDYVQVIRDIPETDLTIEFWFKTTQTDVGIFVVGDNPSPNNGGHDREIYIDNDGYMQQRVYNTEVITGTTPALNDNSWHHYAMVIEQGVGQKMYVDGQLEATGSQDHSDFTDQDRFTFGYSRSRAAPKGSPDPFDLKENKV